MNGLPAAPLAPVPPKEGGSRQGAMYRDEYTAFVADKKRLLAGR